jgi:hypothetical protein
MTSAPIVFLVDVDNTLLDNDRIQRDLQRHREREFGAERFRAWGPTVILSGPDGRTHRRPLDS